MPRKLIEIPQFGPSRLAANISLGEANTGVERNTNQVLKQALNDTSSFVDVSGLTNFLNALNEQKKIVDAQKQIQQASIIYGDDINAFSSICKDVEKKVGPKVYAKAKTTVNKLFPIVEQQTQEKAEDLSRDILKEKISGDTFDLLATYASYKNHQLFSGSKSKKTFNYNESIQKTLGDIYNNINARVNNTPVFSEAEKANLLSRTGATIFEKYCDLYLQENNDVSDVIDRLNDGRLLKQFFADKDFMYNGVIKNGESVAQNFVTVSPLLPGIIANKYIDETKKKIENDCKALLSGYTEVMLGRKQSVDDFSQFGKLSANEYWESIGSKYFIDVANPSAVASNQDIFYSALQNVSDVSDRFRYIPTSMSQSIIGAVESGSPFLMQVGLVAIDKIAANNPLISQKNHSFYDNLGIALFCNNKVKNGMSIEAVAAMYQDLKKQNLDVLEKNRQEFLRLDQDTKDNIVSAVSKRVLGNVTDDLMFRYDAVNEVGEYFKNTKDMDSSILAASISLKNKFGYTKTFINGKDEVMVFPPSMFYGKESDGDAVLRERVERFVKEHIAINGEVSGVFVRSDDKTVKQVREGSLSPSYAIRVNNEFGIEEDLLDKNNIPIRIGRSVFEQEDPEKDNREKDIDLRLNTYKMLLAKKKVIEKDSLDLY